MLLQIFLGIFEDKTNSAVFVRFKYILYFLINYKLFQWNFKFIRPDANREFCDPNVASEALHFSMNNHFLGWLFCSLRESLYIACKSLEVRWIISYRFICYPLLYLAYHHFWLVWGNARAPSGANSFCSVYQDHWDYWSKRFGFYLCSLLFYIFQNCIVFFSKYFTCYVVQRRKYVSWAGCVGASHCASAELSDWQQQIYIIWTDEILSHFYDWFVQTFLSMMVQGVLRYVARELRDFQFAG